MWYGMKSFSCAATGTQCTRKQEINSRHASQPAAAILFYFYIEEKPTITGSNARQFTVSYK